ncbi:lipase 3-like [Periplaneta americana]|uniref:lipase 3-like n=1 Tax=Periplaneta americana TaxID=6978 RepID=UPI0037E78D75
MTSYVLNVYLVIVTTDILCLCSKSNSVECSGTSVLQKKPDYKLSTPEMVIKYGYPAETHTVATEDGYILTIHRIPYSPNNTTRKHRPVVFLQHGLLCSSFDWIILGPGKALAYLLADEGYDVWIGNARGNVYSRKHKSFTLQQRQFWNFSWHEMGVYDLPAVIDFILARTDQQDLSYFGHSMGTTMFLVLMSMKPMYNSKIRLMVAFAPVAFMSHIRSQFTKIAIYSRTGEEADQLYNSDYFPPSKTWGEIVQVFCSNWAITQHLCSSLIFILGGFDPQQLDRTLLPVIMSHYPAGSSTKAWVHYGQLMRTGKFQQYDHSEALNLKYYGTTKPPEYNLSFITAPICTYNGENDWLSTKEDTEQLHSFLPNVVGKNKVSLKAFNHFDFLWAKDAKTLLYDDVIHLLKKYKNKKEN